MTSNTMFTKNTEGKKMEKKGVGGRKINYLQTGINRK